MRLALALLILTLLLALLLAASALAAEKTAKCEITSGNKVEFSGKCRFLPEGDGSFSLSRADEKPLYGKIAMVSVYVVEPGVAEVRGLTTGGINSRWGEARRSDRDKACWVGEDFRVCAR